MNEEIIIDYLEKQKKCFTDIQNNLNNTILEIFQILNNARDNSKRVYIMGNGGSASTSTHFCSDLLKTSLVKGKEKFQAFSLCDNIPVILAWGNDSSFDDIYSQQLKNILQKDDVVIAISGSGNSTNVLNAAEYANQIDAKTISLTGKDGGKLAKICSTNLIIPSNDMLTIETMHLLVCHTLTTLLRSQGEPLFSY